ncbi:DUF6086 family protein [Streptomyces sp. UH6]|uniref:DUF6086 family protein n=1 Tax=Streptomyces sp. UH6 TaxID=2748379 RepID=UPI0015D49BFB|nr:DUF6086 family protein [Streptomyces sp. UH6]NYV78809.1 hypothetical protein [Streptomyces sp. UH6]
MSQYFLLGGDTVLWNPATGVARLFLRQVPVFEAETGLPSGFGPMINDECEVDAAALEVFANALLDHHRRTIHAIRAALSEGFVATAVTLAERAGAALRWEAPPDERARLRAELPAGSAEVVASAEDEGLRAMREMVRWLDGRMGPVTGWYDD